MAPCRLSRGVAGHRDRGQGGWRLSTGHGRRSTGLRSLGWLRSIPRDGPGPLAGPPDPVQRSPASALPVSSCLAPRWSRLSRPPSPLFPLAALPPLGLAAALQPGPRLRRHQHRCCWQAAPCRHPPPSSMAAGLLAAGLRGSPAGVRLRTAQGSVFSFAGAACLRPRSGAGSAGASGVRSGVPRGRSPARCPTGASPP